MFGGQNRNRLEPSLPPAAAQADQQIDGPSCRRGLLGALALCICCPLAAWAQPSLEVLGTWGGAVNTVFVDEAEPDIAYIGSGRRLVILDVADPANILELGSIDLGNLVLDLKVQDGFAFVATHFEPNCFCVVDVSVRSNPVLVWTNGCGQSRAREVDLYQNAAYIRNHSDLMAYDISDPANPRLRDRVLSDAANLADLIIVGDLMYLLYDAWDGLSAAGLMIADLSIDPLNPSILGQVRVAPLRDHETGLSVDVDGAFAYITIQEGADFAHRLAVIDVSNPRAPFVCGTLEGQLSLPHDVAVSAGYAYVADHFSREEEHGTLRILDVAQPCAPAPMPPYESHAAIMGVEIVGQRAYVMDEGEGLVILDLTDPGNPLRLGNWHSPTELRKMEMVGGLLHVTDKWNGITILDMSAPAMPILAGVYQTEAMSSLLGTTDGNRGIAVRSGLAYLSAGMGGLEVVDVSDPSNATQVARFPFNPCIYSAALELDGDIAHLTTSSCSGGGWLVNFDISDLRNIRDVGALSVGGPPLTIDTRWPGGISFMAEPASNGGALDIVDNSDPANPTWIGAWLGGVDLARNGNLVFLSNDERPDVAGLYTYDVSDPFDPILISHFPTRRAYGVAVTNNVVFLVAMDPANGGRGTLFALDVADPAAPSVLTKSVLPETTRRTISVLVDGSFVYVTTISTGVVVFQFSLPGDLNCDGQINAFDIEPFLVALFDPQNYAIGYPGCDINNGDTNGDGSIDAFDIEPFLGLLFGP